jgi:hypothetical protein
VSWGSRRKPRIISARLSWFTRQSEPGPLTRSRDRSRSGGAQHGLTDEGALRGLFAIVTKMPRRPVPAIRGIDVLSSRGDDGDLAEPVRPSEHLVSSRCHGRSANCACRQCRLFWLRHRFFRRVRDACLHFIPAPPRETLTLLPYRRLFADDAVDRHPLGAVEALQPQLFDRVVIGRRRVERDAGQQHRHRHPLHVTDPLQHMLAR